MTSAHDVAASHGWTKLVRSISRGPTLVSRLLLVGISCAVLAIGCTRQHWRRQADNRAYCILEEKQFDPRWTHPRIDLQPDPRSRFYDPYDPDRPPLPPDDPAAHQYMHWVYGMHGWKGWHGFGDTATTENPTWLEPFGLPPAVVESNFRHPALLPEIRDLSLGESISLAYIHSREYQTELENLYLSALQLTFERFRFDVQFLGLSNRRPSNDTIFESDPGRSDSITSTSRVGVNQYLPTGGQWAVELLNNTVWLFSQDPRETTATTLSYSLVQPLLMNGGRRFALENLTQAERNTLYALRNFARYRMGFFTNLVAGNGVASGTSSSGTVSGSTTLGGSVVGGALVNGSSTGGFVNAGTTTGAAAGAANVGGYLGLLQQRQTILNQQNNIRLLQEQLARLKARSSDRPVEISEELRALPPGVRIPPALAGRMRFEADRQRLWLEGQLTDQEVRQLIELSHDDVYQQAIRNLAERASAETVTLAVAQLASQLANSRTTLNTSVRTLQDLLDRFKIQMGLPTDMPITVDEGLLKPFQLIDARITDVQTELDQFVTEWASIPEDDPPLPRLRQTLASLQRLNERVRDAGFAVVAEDQQRVADNMDERLAGLPESFDPQRIMTNVARDRQFFSNLREEWEGVSQRLNEMQVSLEPVELGADQRRQALAALADLREDLMRLSQGLAVVQIYARVELIRLNPFAGDLEPSIALALENRPDLMNVQGQVMDVRRQLEVAANQLQAVLNLTASGELRTQTTASGNLNPFDFRGDQSAFRAGVQFTAPIQLVSQRNAYRASLIAFQRARRNAMFAEDSVKLDIRTAWRQIVYARQNFEIAREAVRLATVQYDQTVEQTFGPSAANAGAQQGLNLLQALNTVLTAQNNLIGIWMNYEASRLNIHRDMGIMQVNPQGFWTDPFYLQFLDQAQAWDCLADDPAAHAPPALPAELPEPAHGPQLLPNDRASSSPNTSTAPVARLESRPARAPRSLRIVDRRTAAARGVPEVLHLVDEVVDDHREGPAGTVGDRGHRAR